MCKKINKTTFIFIIVGIILFLITALGPIKGDFLGLVPFIKYYVHNNKIRLLVEPSFWLIVFISVFISKYIAIGSVRLMIIFYGILGVFLNLYAIRKLSYFPILALIVYIGVSYNLHQLQEAREGIASAIFMLAIPDIVNKNFKSYLLKTIAATLFHYSAFVMFFAYFINRKKTEAFEFLFYLILPFIGIGFYFIKIGQLIIMHILPYLPIFIQSKLDSYIKLFNTHKINNFDMHGFTILGFIAIYYFFLFNIKKIKKPLDKVLIKLLGWLIFIFYTFAFLPVISGRMVTQFGFGAIIILLLPELVYIIKEKKIAYALVILYSVLIFIDYAIIGKNGSQYNLHSIMAYFKNGL
jgi:hypothetical protein